MDQKEKIKKTVLFASLLFTKEEIVLLLKSEDDLKDEDEAFEFGNLSSQFTMRKSLFNEAKGGSVAALKEWDMMVHKIKNQRGLRR